MKEDPHNHPDQTPRPELVGLEPSFGFGDRTGLATPGHVQAMREAGQGLRPIFAQQSIREMARTGRDPDQVLRDAFEGMTRAGWTAGTGADADHVKTADDVERMADAGFTFFTLDPSDHVDDAADRYNEAALRERYAAVRDVADWASAYGGCRVQPDGAASFTITDEAAMRAAVKYGPALQGAIRLAFVVETVQTTAGRPFEIELSVDETDSPTTPAEHWMIGDQCRRQGVKLVSLAPRLVGALEKGVDYIGDVAELRRQLEQHAAIARTIGPYKLSLHSGSDKLSIYRLLAEVTHSCYHVKTAGTSYLEALRVAAREEPAFFRELCRFARERYEEDKRTYHVHATLRDVAEPSSLDDRALEDIYLGCWSDVPEGEGFTGPGRQILHCTFGSVLAHETHGPRLRGLLEAHPETHAELLRDHFVRHLKALRGPQ